MLVNSCQNVYYGEHERRMLITGVHIVCDVYCTDCRTCLGWQFRFFLPFFCKRKESPILLLLPFFL